MQPQVSKYTKNAFVPGLVAADVVLLPLEETNSPPLNLLAGFEGPLRGGRKGEKGRMGGEKERDRKDRRKTPHPK